MRALLLIACAIGGARELATPRPTPRPNLREDDAVKGNHGLRNGPARTKQPALVSTAEGVLPLLYDKQSEKQAAHDPKLTREFSQQDFEKNAATAGTAAREISSLDKNFEKLVDSHKAGDIRGEDDALTSLAPRRRLSLACSVGKYYAVINPSEPHLGYDCHSCHNGRTSFSGSRSCAKA